uniref:exocyst complex component 6B-like isoform X1 n=1 Tax=Styela clava TaxID=7725 RepID=UPI00193A760A|nr:exocyst complex component 6B-like isoform X1 [Styela clava]
MDILEDDVISGGDQELDTDREHERILKEIETTDTAFIGASLRAVCEGSDHDKFLQKLDQRIKQHDRDIERLCNFHYQGFIESITELIKVRGDAEKLKNQVVLINNEQQESGKELCRKCQDLIQCRLQQRNIASAIDELTMCLPVLQTYGKMQDQIKAGRYYSALKTLEKLEHTYLPPVHRYRYCEIMIENIPKIREHIKEVSKSELKDFLEVVRKNSPKIGKLAMCQVDQEKNFKLSEADGARTSNNFLLGQESLTEVDRHLMSNSHKTSSKKKRKAPKKNPPESNIRINPFDQSYDDLNSSNPFAETNGISSNPFAEEITDETDGNPFAEGDGITDEHDNAKQLLSENSKDVSPSDLIDFSPVYKCLHIFGILKFRDQFEKYYRIQRRTQAEIALQPPNNMHESLEGYTSFFHQIVGFFVIEDHILHTANNLVDQAYIDSLWDMALSEIVAVLRTDSDYCGDADMLMAVKNHIVIFADTLKAYGFDVDQLFSLLIEMREQYSDILLKKWSRILQTIFDEDNYTPIQITSDTEEMELLSSFPYEDVEFIKASFPKQLPFSRFVPRVFNEIKSFVKACLEYCEDLHLSSTEVDDMIRKSTNLLLTRTLSTELQKLVQKPTLGLLELVQITINTSYLENSCSHVEEFVHSITGVDSSASHTAKLVGVSTFKDARSETESQIYIKVNSKVDEFFELAEYNWSMSEAMGTASSYLLDLIAYLRHNFRVFSHLPEKVAQTACMSACKHIATRLMETLMDRDIRQITMAALQQFNLDVMQCEFFSSSDPVPGFQDGVLQMSFLELRQLLDLFLSWDWSSYLADYGSGNSKYLRVGPATALSLLEKIREDSKRRNIFTSFNRQEREKKKLLETVLKQLRNIVNDWTLLCVPYNKLNKKRQERLQY